MLNPDLLADDPQGRTRVRFSFMPEAVAEVVDVRTSPMTWRIRSVNDFVAAGSEVHAHFSPATVHGGWEAHWRELFARSTTC